MLQIAICDDDPQHRLEIYSLIQKVFFSRTEIQVSHFEDGAQVIEALEKRDRSFDLLFLDIHMHLVDGMETAEYIRKNRIDMDIIFVTVSREHVYEGYTYKAFAYLLKPLDEQRMVYELNRYLEEKEQTETYLNIPVRGTIQRVPVDKVMYFESDTRKILVHMKQEVLEFYAKLDEIEEVVGDRNFVRCHQSYLVNKNYVVSQSRTGLLVGDTEIPVSRKYQKKMKELWG